MAKVATIESLPDPRFRDAVLARLELTQANWYAHRFLQLPYGLWRTPNPVVTSVLNPEISSFKGQKTRLEVRRTPGVLAITHIVDKSFLVDAEEVRTTLPRPGTTRPRVRMGSEVGTSRFEFVARVRDHGVRAALGMRGIEGYAAQLHLIPRTIPSTNSKVVEVGAPIDPAYEDVFDREPIHNGFEPSNVNSHLQSAALHLKLMPVGAFVPIRTQS